MSHNTYIHRAVRVLVRPLARTPVTPNQITTLRLAGGIGACALFASGPDQHLMAGAWLFLFSMVLDRADGEL
ncbi:MAG: CDP-alcohol phosphatidyltransferase family protein, partial [Rhodospirillales bacterium]